MSLPIIASTPVMACTFSPAYTWAGWELTATHSVWTLIRLSPEHKPTAMNNRLCKLHYTMELVISEQRTNSTVLAWFEVFWIYKTGWLCSHCRCVGSPTWNFSGQWDTDTVCTRPGTLFMMRVTNLYANTHCCTLSNSRQSIYSYRTRGQDWR